MINSFKSFPVFIKVNLNNKKLIDIDKVYPTLIDSYITESISPPINSYKISDDRIVMEIDNKKVSLLL